MLRSRLMLVLGVVVACSATTPTPSGTRVVEWDLSMARPSPPPVAGNKASHEKTLQSAGVELRVNFDTADIVMSDGATKHSPINVVVTVVQSGGYTISGGTSGYPVHMAGAPPDLLSIDFRGTLTKGRTGCTGTRYDNETMNVRIRGDGSAELRPDADPPPPKPSARTTMRQ
ncbi:MAG TPA: hypothetical protein VFB62_22090 [Polyangiaceae bacterium]|nr:hypothetical protein [Polyangiaceae bacterium]